MNELSDDEPTPNGGDLVPVGEVSEGSSSSEGSTPSGLAPQPQAVRSALANLPVPQPNERFWNQLDLALEEESPMQIMPRPAIRPITQPPPRSGGDVVEDVFDRGGHRTGAGKRLRGVGGRKRTSPEMGLGKSGRSTRMSGLQRLFVLVGIAALVGLAALGGLFDDDPGNRTVTDGDQAEPDEPEGDASAEGDAEGEENEEEPAASEEEPETPMPRGLAADVPLHAEGIGPLQPGLMTLRNVAEVTGVDPEVDTQAFDFSGGRCFDAHVPGAEDVTLSVRSPEPSQGVEDPYDGIVAALVIASSPGSLRTTDAGVSLGTSEEDLVAAYGDVPLSQAPNPYHPDGSIYLAESPDSENAVAYFTGFNRVIEIRAGHAPLVGRTRLCE